MRHYSLDCKAGGNDGKISLEKYASNTCAGALRAILRSRELAPEWERVPPLQQTTVHTQWLHRSAKAKGVCMCVCVCVCGEEGLEMEEARLLCAFENELVLRLLYGQHLHTHTHTHTHIHTHTHTHTHTVAQLHSTAA